MGLWRRRVRYAVTATAAAHILGHSASASSATPRPSAAELLDCEGDQRWSEFRQQLRDNAGKGFPVDLELATSAQKLLELHNEALTTEPAEGFGATLGMHDFFLGCNAPPVLQDRSPVPDPFCLYGSVAALWLLARTGHPDKQKLLEHAEFLLGKATRYSLDFMESSSWPVTSLDVHANLRRPDGDFRLPGELPELGLPYPGAGERPTFDLRPGPLEESAFRYVIWEIGVHASLSAEPLQMWARFIPRARFEHRNLIQDQYPMWLPDKCKSLYDHPRLACDIVEDDITRLFRRRLPRSATSKDPIEGIHDFVSEFRAVVGERRRDVDAFVCTVAYLCLLVEGLGVPVIGYFGHPLLFMVPTETEVREAFWPRFVSMASTPSVGFAVTDPFLQMQFEYQVGIPRLPAIRTNALYTGVTHMPVRDKEVLVMDRPHESVLMCVIQRLLLEETEVEGGTRGEDAAEWPRKEGRLRAASSPGYPFKFLTRALTDRTFETFAQFRAVALWPYDMDLITFYEFYSMNMPIFMPSHLPRYIFQQDHMDYDGQWRERRTDPTRASLWPASAGDASPFDEGNINAVRHTVSFTDYFQHPHVQYFASVPDLLRKLVTANFFEVVQSMARHNQEMLVETSAAWRALLLRTTGWDGQALHI